MGALTLNSQTIGDGCLFPIIEKIPQKPAGIIGGVWEQEATFDNRSPAFYYKISFICIKVEGMSCPEDVKLYVSGLRDLVGEGPFAGSFAGESQDRNFTNLIWAATPVPSSDQKRWDQFTVEVQSPDEPTIPT